jgi:hypothetical protein
LGKEVELWSEGDEVAGGPRDSGKKVVLAEDLIPEKLKQKLKIFHMILYYECMLFYYV